MKFPGEKKSTLCIYTDSMATEKLASNSLPRAPVAVLPAPPTPPSSHVTPAPAPAAASEAAALRKELETTRAALRRQEARCRSIAAAFGAKVRRREEAAAAERRLRDRQLAAVLRALAHLEQRLRTEQRLIRRQLAERDATIHAQTEELHRLRAAEEERPERFRWPADAPEDSPAPPRVLTRGPPTASTTSTASGSHRFTLTPRAPRPTRSKSASHLPPCGTNKQQQSPPPPPAAHRSTHIIESESEATLLRFRPHLSSGVTPVAGSGAELDCGTLDSDSGVFHGSDGSDSSLRSDEAPTRGDTAVVTNACCDYDPDDDLPTPARDLAKHYAHNPVLECVSQILLRDRCEEGGGGSSPPEPPPPLAPSQGGGRRRAPPPPALWPAIREERESIADDSADAEETPSETSRPPPSPSAPARAQHLQERACALLTRRLTVASHPDLEQVDDAGESPPPPMPPPQTPPSPPTDLSESLPPASPPRGALPNGATQPPAVPPKPPQLGAMGRLRRRPPARSPPVVASRSPVPTPATTHPSGGSPPTPGPAMRPHRQILSNGSLLKAAAAASAAAAAANGVTASPESEAIAMACERAAGACATSVARVRGVGPVAARVQRQLEQQQQRSGAASAVGAASTIRVGSSVSSLITGAAGGSIVNELTRDRHPDSLHSHFEEFRLEDVDIGDPERSSGDGGAYPNSSSSTPSASPSPPHSSHAVAVATSASATSTTSASSAGSACEDVGTYEGFLEATGLSQKPLLTPSRLLSNHRSMLKPKDVKLRSRAARAVSTGTGAPPPDRPPPVVRYWVEPFL